MPKLSENLYGADDNAFAASIASDALTPSVGEPSIWGPIEDVRAQSEANVGKESLGPTDPNPPVTVHNMKDGRAVSKGNMGGKGPSTATATGGRDSLVPANQTSKNGKQQSPAFHNETS